MTTDSRRRPPKGMPDDPALLAIRRGNGFGMGDRPKPSKLAWRAELERWRATANSNPPRNRRGNS